MSEQGKRLRANARLSLVVPMYNEEDALGAFFETIEPVLRSLEMEYEVVCVDDGSRDNTFRLLRDRVLQQPSIRAIRLSRNFGKEAALTAGIDLARGDVVVPNRCRSTRPSGVSLRVYSGMGRRL